MKVITLTAALALAMALILSCTSNVEMPPHPDDFVGTGGSSSSGSEANSSGSENSSSSTEQGNSSSSIGGSSSSSIVQIECPPYNATTHFCDTRDGTVYKYEIAPSTKGGGYWMSENLNYSKGGTIGYCYKASSSVLGTSGEDLASCNGTYGRNYTWAEAMAGNSLRGVCPSGWHIPSATEWQTIGASTTTSGTRNMSTGFYVYSGNYNTNSGTPGSSGYPWVLGWIDRGTYGFYWASDANNYYAFMSSSQFQIRTDAHAHGGAEYYSVRCLKDGTGSLPACQYQPSWCGGASLADVKYNVPSPCIFIKGVTSGSIALNGMLINGNVVASFDNSYPKVDGGYYIYAGSGYEITNMPATAIVNTTQDCNVNGN